MFVRLAVLFGAVFLSGCVYFNGVYNAKEAERHGDGRMRHGDESGAMSFYQQAVTSAESVLARHPDSKWRTRALYLSGRSAALTGSCDIAVNRLQEFLATQQKVEREHQRATLALSTCELRTGKINTARARLDSLVDVKDREIARSARLWASRAALAANDRSAAERYLEGMDNSTMAWELVSASISARDYDRAESLVVKLAGQGEYRDEVMNLLREMWNAGEIDGAERIVRKYDGARVRDNARVAMHYALGEYNLRLGRDSVARQHLNTARELAGRDTVVQHEAGARLSLMGIHGFKTLAQVDSVFFALDSSSRSSQYSKRINEQVLLVKLLEQRDDPSGGSLFLAGEVARDSLKAPDLAVSLFLRVARDVSNSPFAPSALYAASLLEPDSAEVWRSRILGDFTASHVAAWMRGEDPSTRSDYSTNATLLRSAWFEASKAWADTVRKLRQPPPANGRPPSSTPSQSSRDPR
jgi:hypothetical protein